jgi:hypothetical protein
MPVAGSVMTGTGGWLAVTVSVASALVIEPAELLTFTRNFAPLSLSSTSLSVYLSLVAPAMFTPLRCH